MHLAAVTEATYLNRKLNFMWLPKHCSAFGCIQEASITRSLSVCKRLLCLRAVYSKWPRERISPLQAVFSTDAVKIARSRKDKRVRVLISLSSPSCGISWVSAVLLLLVKWVCVSDQDESQLAFEVAVWKELQAYEMYMWHSTLNCVHL